MLKPLPPSLESKQNFVVIDIENKPSGECVAIDCCWRVANGFDHFTCKDWSLFWPWLIDAAKHDADFRVLYAHNGGGWDWVHLLHWLMDAGKMQRKQISIVSVGSRIIMMMVIINKEYTLKFCDSMALLRSGLDDLGKIFFGKGKDERCGLFPHEILVSDPDRFYRYLKRDTELTVQVLEKSLQIIRDKIAPIKSLGVTIGGTAMKVFRHFISNPISIPTETDVKRFLRKGYKGGRVGVFQYGYHKNINIYDVNSLYPFVMANTAVPISGDGYWCKKLTLNRCGFWHVVGNQRNCAIPPVLLGGLPEPYSFDGVYGSDELKLLFEVGNPEIKLQIGYVFRDTDFVFKGFVAKLYGLRLEYPDTPVSLMAKYLLNSCYGKFGQKQEREMIVVCETFADAQERSEENKCRIIDMKRMIIGETKDVRCNHEHVGIAAIITSRARVELYRGMLHAGNQLVYVDTDSVHTTGTMPPDLVGVGLGQFKHEFSGEGVYCGRKTYGLRLPSGKEKIRAKGVRVSQLQNCTLNFDDLLRVSNGEEINTVFQSTATPLEAMKGVKKVCSFGNESETRKRKVRMT